MSLKDLDRNDTASALAFAEELIKAGKYDTSTAQVLIMLQDDPDELIEGLDLLLNEHGE